MTGREGRKDELVDLLRSLLIVNLATAGISNHDIRRIVGCDMNRVSAIAKFVKRTTTDGKVQESRRRLRGGKR